MYNQRGDIVDFDFADVPVIDGHIHLKHPERIGGIVAVMEAVPYARTNLLSMPHPDQINQNPAVIRFKAHYPDRAYISGGLDYTQVLEGCGCARRGAGENLAKQIDTLKAIGFDGLKMHEGEPQERKWIGLALDAPEYEGMWARLEALGMPIVLHQAAPGEFWDAERIPEWARSYAGGCFYGDGSYPLKEDLYEEVERVLERHPRLRLILAHLYFLSADLERASRFLDAHPSVCFDLTPGLEMLNNLSRTPDAAREFLIAYQDRLIYGTDITSADLEAGDEFGMKASLAKAWVVRAFLERDDVFAPPEEIGFWLYPGLDGFQGLDLPRDVLDKIYCVNLERLYGPAPAPLDREAALVELERLAAALDARAGGEGGENPARRVAAELKVPGT